MMKKILSLILVLAICSSASALTASFRVAADDMKESYAASDIITIELVSDSDILGISLNVGADGGTAQDPRDMAQSLTDLRNLGALVNAGGLLITGINGSTPFGGAPVLAGGVLYSFEFHVPELPPSSIILIDDVTDMGASPPLSTSIMTSAYAFISDVDGVEIHTPEPTTIALLGLGALSMLRRRRKA